MRIEESTIKDQNTVSFNSVFRVGGTLESHVQRGLQRRGNIILYKVIK